MHFSIDRFENGIAVCVNDSGLSIDIPASLLPPEAREGSIIEPDGDGGYSLCPAQEAEKRRTNFCLAEDLFE